MPKQPQAPSKKKCLCQLAALFKSVGIQVASSAFYDQDEYDLLVYNINGEICSIILKESGPQQIFPDIVILPLRVFSGNHLTEEVFHLLTTHLGYGKPPIVTRGDLPTEKITHNDHFDLIVMRHREFRNVPNPPPVVLESYKDTQLWLCRKFYSTNCSLCHQTSLDVDDLMQYVSVWTCIFHGQYELRDNPQDNKKFFICYIKQRFLLFRKMLYQKLKTVAPDYDSISAGFYDKPFTPNFEFESDIAARSADSILQITPGTADLGILKDEDKIDSHPPLTPASAVKKINKALDALPHDTLVELLTFAVNNSFINPEARKVAKRQLNKHTKKCSVCLSNRF